MNEPLPDIMLVALPAFLLLIAIGALTSARRGDGRYRGRDTAANVTLGLGNALLAAALGGLVLLVYSWLYQHRLFTLPMTAWWAWVLCFLADDLTYYWFHRISHESRWFWASHSVHHSSERYNFSVSLRQTWTGTPTGSFLFWAWMPLVGFHPAMVLLMQSVSLIYQFWIHTEAIDRLGFLEKFMNTPSHHRVHHGSNGIYIDKNYAGILIIWDKLFGTFQEERRDVPVKYGLVHDLKTFSLPTVIFHETAFMLRQVWNAKGWRNKLGWIFGPPEWSPDGPQYPPDHPYWQTQAATKAS